MVSRKLRWLGHASNSGKQPYKRDRSHRGATGTVHGSRNRALDPRMVHRVAGALALVIVAAWTIHTVVLAGDTLLAQQPSTLLGAMATESQRVPPSGFRQAIVAAGRLLPAKASVAVSNRTIYRQNYVYYWATYKLYPDQVWVVGTTDAAAESAPDYILDIRDPQRPEVVPPAGYVTKDIGQFDDGIVMVLLAHA